MVKKRAVDEISRRHDDEGASCGPDVSWLFIVEVFYANAGKDLSQLDSDSFVMHKKYMH